jgi:4-hydroxyphenylpyruvate dioxygenase-like putative hemolysin
MDAEPRASQLHHIVFAIAPERHDAAVDLFTEVGYTLQGIELNELGLQVHLDWNGGVELISPVPGSTEPVAVSVNEFLEVNGDGVYTVVLQVPAAQTAESIAERFGGATRFRQSFAGEGSYLHEVDMSVLGLPLTFLSTNVH